MVSRQIEYDDLTTIGKLLEKTFKQGKYTTGERKRLKNAYEDIELIRLLI